MRYTTQDIRLYVFANDNTSHYRINYGYIHYILIYSVLKVCICIIHYIL
jgi:hypothetical protein